MAPVLTEEELKNLPPEIQKKLAPLLSGGVKTGKVLNFIGAKGGIGTTTIAVNVALGLQELQKSVAIVDMNPLFGEIPIFLNIKPVFDWGEISKDVSRLDTTYLMGVLTKHRSGIHVLPSPERFNGYASSGIVEKLLSQMKELFNYTVVDSGRQLDDSIADVTKTADTIFLVTSLTIPCLVNVKKLLWTIQNLGYSQDRIRIIVSQKVKDPVSIKTAEQTINKGIFWIIPENSQVVTSAINKGEPILCSSENSDICKSIRDLVKKI